MRRCVGRPAPDEDGWFEVVPETIHEGAHNAAPLALTIERCINEGALDQLVLFHHGSYQENMTPH